MRFLIVPHVFLLLVVTHTLSVGCSLCKEELDRGSDNQFLPFCAEKAERFINGVHKRPTPFSPGRPEKLLPPWTNISKAIEGQQFAMDNLAGIVQAYMFGILSILSNPQISQTLLATGNSDTGYKASRRYAATIVQVALWMRRPLSKDPHDNWVLTSISNVRELHNNASLRLTLNNSHNKSKSVTRKPRFTEMWTAFEDDLRKSAIPQQHRNYSDPSKFSNAFSTTHPMNQFTLAMTQWAFLGPVMMNPVALNVYNTSQEGLLAFAHLWAVLGHAMGLEDEFNLGLKSNLTEIKKLNVSFFKLYILPALYNLDEETKFLMEAFINGAGGIIIGLDPEYLIRGILRDVVGIEPSTVNLRQGLYGSMVDIVVGPWGPRLIHFLIPKWDMISSPVMSLYHFIIGFLHFGTKYTSDESIAKNCFYYH